MPYRSNKPCAKPNCSKLIKAGNTYCKEHEKEYNYQRNKRYDDKQRDEKLQKFYQATAWRKLRNRKIKADPLCEKCKEQGRTKVAKEVDHIVPIKVNWNLRLSYDNLQSLCPPCHARKTRKDTEKYDF